MSTLWDWKVSGHREVIRIAKDVMQTYRDTGVVTKDLIQAEREHRQSLLAARRAYSDIRLLHRQYNAELIESVRVIRSVAQMGRTAVYMWQAHGIAQMRVADAQARYADSSEKVAELEQLRTQYARDFGEQSVYTIDVTEKLERAIRRQEDTQKDLIRTQKDNRLGYISLGIAMLDFVPQSASVYMQLRRVKDMMFGVSTAAGTAKLAIRSIAAEYALLATALSAPIIATIFIKYVKERFEDTPYWMEPDITQPRGARPGLNIWELMKDSFENWLSKVRAQGPIFNFTGDIYGVGDLEDAGRKAYDAYMDELGKHLR